MSVQEYQAAIAELAKQLDDEKILRRIFISLQLAVQEKGSD